MTEQEKDKLWAIMRDMGMARDRFFVYFSGAGRDVDLRDELLKMEASVKQALNVLGFLRR